MAFIQFIYSFLSDSLCTYSAVVFIFFNNRSEDEKSTWPIGGKNISLPINRHAGQVPY